MRISVVGRGHVGGGLADLWERAGHQVTRLGRDGGNVSDAEVVLLAVPWRYAAALPPPLTVAGKCVFVAMHPNCASGEVLDLRHQSDWR